MLMRTQFACANLDRYTVARHLSPEQAMAKRRGRKSEAIKAVLADNPTATVREVQTALAARRVKASVALISKLKRRKPFRNGRANGLTLEHLLAAKGLVAKVGSIEAAKSALASYAKLI
jgi:hypothetical protein